MGKRAYGMTNSEISSIIWIMSLVFIVISVKVTFDTLGPYMNIVPGFRSAAMIVLLLCFMSMLFSFGSMALPNYLISKYDLNILVDRIKNPDFIGWIRYTRNKKLCFQTVKTGPLGKTEGLADNEKADVINDGSYTVTTPCGNQAIIVNDLLPHNINLEQAVGWSLIKKHFHVVGFKAWEKAQDDGKLVYKHKSNGVKRKPLIWNKRAKNG